MPNKRVDPLARVWHWALMLLGITILLTVTISLLARILVWLLITGAIVAVAFLVLRWRRRQDRW
jgi:hypothetical protein